MLLFQKAKDSKEKDKRNSYNLHIIFISAENIKTGYTNITYCFDPAGC